MIAQLQDNSSALDDRCFTAPMPSGRERLRVLHVVARLGLGGTEHGVLKIIHGLGQEEFEHRICAVRGIDPAFERSIGPSVKSYSAGTPDPGFQFPLFRLLEIIREFRPHIVHTRNFGSLEAIPAARMRRVPVVVHSEHGYEIEVISGLPLRRRVLYRMCYAMVDAVFTVSRDLRLYHAKQAWLSTDIFRIIHNGVNTDKFSPRPETIAKTRAERKIPESRVVVGSVGRLVPIKDHGTLLRAAELLVREGKDVHVLIVGGGPELERLRTFVAASVDLNDRVTFEGASDRVPELLNAMDLFVLPSICEGMSNTILEAMACGLPVIATRVGGNPEMGEEGRSAYFFAPRDFQSLARIIAGLVDDRGLRRMVGNAGRQHTLEEFSLAAMVRQYRDLYLELLAQRNRKEA